MMRCFLSVILLALFMLAGGCSVQTNALFPPKKDEQTRTIFLVSHGWHAGLVVSRLDIQEPSWPELVDFAHVDYLEIGWGDKGYYTSPDPGAGLAARALLLPTSSVLHLVGFSGSPESYFSHSEIIRVELSDAGFKHMVRNISQSFSRDQNDSVLPLGPGIYGNSRFYASRESYYLCKTCNTWTARMLRSAGIPISHAFTVDGLMSQMRRFGVVMQEQSVVK